MDASDRLHFLFGLLVRWKCHTNSAHSATIGIRPLRQKFQPFSRSIYFHVFSGWRATVRRPQNQASSCRWPFCAPRPQRATRLAHVTSHQSINQLSLKTLEFALDRVGKTLTDCHPLPTTPYTTMLKLSSKRSHDMIIDAPPPPCSPHRIQFLGSPPSPPSPFKRVRTSPAVEPQSRKHSRDESPFAPASPFNPST